MADQDNKVREARIAELKARFLANDLAADPQKLAASLIDPHLRPAPAPTPETPQKNISSSAKSST